ncbi:Hypothetical predicted protein [Pelobates cultripes]|uniref:Uncharacterized protein n=1 Tax=Pelobates cultripes TaxID=61616 RepID=A0AAD1RU02_PELCU|nr:Hypothetical predicted protein [Pelobates cultripes]
MEINKEQNFLINHTNTDEYKKITDKIQCVIDKVEQETIQIKKSKYTRDKNDYRRNEVRTFGKNRKPENHNTYDQYRHNSYNPHHTRTNYQPRANPFRDHHNKRPRERIEPKPSTSPHGRTHTPNMRTPIQMEKRAKSDEFLTAQSKFRHNPRRISDISTNNRFEPLEKITREEDFWSLRNKDKHKFLSRQKSPNKRQRSTEEGEIEEAWTHRGGKRDKHNP